MNKIRIQELQKVAREAKYNHRLAQKRLHTAQRRQNDIRADEEYLILGCWADTYQCAMEDLHSMGGA
jgi:hypothetical protein